MTHLLSAMGLGIVVYAVTEDFLLTTSAIIGAGGLDLDHVVEYKFHYGVEAPLAELLRPGSIAQWPQLIFVLHGYEWVVGLVLAAWYWQVPEIMGLIIGILVHLLMDEAGNRLPDNRHRIHPLFYFFTFRLIKGFSTKKISRFI
ncbi:MAG: hypothetical protein HQL55_10795 [Magnetococcales bacterium]|nr:hypothetical protein [Magnetococcales bacterium]